MNPQTLKFILYALFSAASLWAGYTARRRQWLSASISRPIHLHTVLWVWTPVSMFAFWRLQIDWVLLIIMLINPIAMIAGALMTRLACQWLDCNRKTTGVMILSAALSNQGFTLGAYLCYVLIDTAPDRAMAYAIAFVMAMALTMTTVFYPVAARFGQQPDTPLWRLVAGTFVDIRCSPMYAAILGAALSLLAVPFPGALLDHWHLLDLFFFMGALGGYMGIGLRLQFADSLSDWPLHLVLGIVKFIAMPMIIMALALGARGLGVPISGLQMRVMFIEGFAATAINAVVTANLFHLDATRAGSFWLWNTIGFCLIPLPVLILIFGFNFL